MSLQHGGQSRLHPLPRRWMALAVIVLSLFGLGRGWQLWAHEPLYAYANSYDQTRYSACFDLYPDRPADVPPQQNSPQAPFEQFRFIRSDDPLCYWSSELLFDALAASVWRISETWSGPRAHSVRILGALKLGALLALSAALSLGWWRRGRHRVALANAALLAVLWSDPANTLYLNTFYAETSALLAAYALLGMLLLWRGEMATPLRRACLLLAALCLATSKLQHLLLPLLLGAGLFALQWLSTRRADWRVGAMFTGAVLGMGLQALQLQRDGAMMDSIHQYNRADVLLTSLLPFTNDPVALLGELGIDPACAVYSGKHAWELPDMPAEVCSGLQQFGYGAQLRVLASHPRLSLRLAAHSIAALDPWLAQNLGHVEDGAMQALPAQQFSLATPLQRWTWLHYLVLGLPFLGLLVLLRRQTTHERAAALEYSLLTVLLMGATLGVTVLGDGLADTAKQAHLVTNAALAWLLVSVGLALPRRWDQPV
ncbi:MAG: hypothetical protein ABIY56_03560 [Dokdonella sp.]